MTHSGRPKFRPNLVELETRDVPAWWTVSAPVPPEGVLGSTSASHTGSLTLNPDYVAENGIAIVSAATAAEAAVQALEGTISATIDEETVDYIFSSSTVGSTVADHKPFLVIDEGTSFRILLEDMAGFELSDWDYNDRDFPGVSVSMAATPVLHEQTYLSPLMTDANGVEYRDCSVSVTVTREESGEFLWTYEVTNIRFYQHDEDAGQPIESFGVIFANEATVLATDVTSGLNWGHSLSEEFGSNTSCVDWGWNWNYDDALVPTESGTFQFKTPPVPIHQGDIRLGGRGDPFMATAKLAAPGEVRVMITDAAGGPIGPAGLKVAKWENAFAVVNQRAEVKTVNTKTGFDILNTDVDRFHVWVYDKEKWDANTQHVSVKLSTDNTVGFTRYNDPANEVDVVRYNVGAGKDAGWYWSDSQMLVSNEVDDRGSIPGVGNDESAPGVEGPLKNGYKWLKSDRTHRIALRGTLDAEYVFKAGVMGEMDVEPVLIRHEVKLHINRLNVGGVGSSPAITKVDFIKDFNTANETYAQVGILLTATGYEVSHTLAVGGPVNLGNGLDVPMMNGQIDTDTNGVQNLSAEEKALLTQLRSPEATDIEVYYINYFRGTDTLVARSFMKSFVPDRKYADSIVVAKERRHPFTLPHEVFHIISEDGEHRDPTGLGQVNLMRKGGVSPENNTITVSKRLDVAQDTIAHTTRPDLLHD